MKNAYLNQLPVLKHDLDMIFDLIIEFDKE